MTNTDTHTPTSNRTNRIESPLRFTYYSLTKVIHFIILSVASVSEMRDSKGSTRVRAFTNGGLVSASLRPPKTYRILTDHVGSPLLVVNVANASDVPFRATYTAFGEATITGTADFLPFGFAGGLFDIETGLVRFGARDYDPVVGRWTAKDPIRFDGGQANLYVYVGDDPVNKVDIFGRSSLGSCLFDQAAAAYECALVR